MAFTISRPGMTTITAETAEQAAQLVQVLESQDRQRDESSNVKKAFQRADRAIGRVNVVEEVVNTYGSPWTPSQFHSFVDSLAHSSRKLLAELAHMGMASDQELRHIARVDNNQALAGVLSAISKRAAAIGVRAVDVFSVVNHRSDGTRRSEYRISPKFKEAAQEMNWIELVRAEE